MDRPEIISVLRQGHDEIVMLRRRIAELEPKARAYDTIERIAALSDHTPPQGYGIDAAWRIKSAVDELVAEREVERANTDEAQN